MKSEHIVLPCNLFNRIWRLSPLLLTIVFALPANAEQSQAVLIEQLLQRLTEQEQINQQLLQRVEKLEAAQRDLLSGLEDDKRSDTASSEVSVTTEYSVQMEIDTAEALDLSRQLDARLGDRPELSGYFDLEYFNDDSTRNHGEFRQHHLSLHINKDLAPFRFFSEVEFEYAPAFKGEGGAKPVEGRGEIKAEEAWVEYQQSDLFNIRGGLNVEPGYWNVHHYPNITLSTRRPLLVRNIFPRDFVGVLGYGSQYHDRYGWSYHLLVANGQSDDYGKHDDNESKAAGAGLRLHLMPNRFDTFDVGIRGYSDNPTVTDRTSAWGFDTQIRQGSFELLAQLAMLDAVNDRTGIYIQPGFRSSDQLTTFLRYDLLDIDNGDKNEEFTLGVNFQPLPQLSLKLEYFHSKHSLTEDFNGLAASLAMAFGAYDQ